MARNDFRKTPVLRLPHRARVFRDAAEADPEAVGLTPEALAAIGEAADALDAANARVLACERALRAATAARGARFDECAERLAEAATLVYARLHATPEAAAELGLSVRRAGRTRVVPRTPTGLVATPMPGDRVALHFSRGDNDETVIFRVDARGATGGWRFAGSGTRTRFVLSEIPAGVPALIRVVATRGRCEATPTLPVNVYGGLVSSARDAA